MKKLILVVCVFLMLISSVYAAQEYSRPRIRTIQDNPVLTGKTPIISATTGKSITSKGVKANSAAFGIQHGQVVSSTSGKTTTPKVSPSKQDLNSMEKRAAYSASAQTFTGSFGGKTTAFKVSVGKQQKLVDLVRMNQALGQK